jgi:hypothetical protein
VHAYANLCLECDSIAADVGGKQQYFYVRRAKRNAKRLRRQYIHLEYGHFRKYDWSDAALHYQLFGYRSGKRLHDFGFIHAKRNALPDPERRQLYAYVVFGKVCPAKRFRGY